MLPNLGASVPSLRGHSALGSRICGEESEKGKQETKKMQSFISSRSPQNRGFVPQKKKCFQTKKKRETPRARDPDTDSEFKIPSTGATAKPARPARRRQSPRPAARGSSGGAGWARGRADRAASRLRGRDGLAKLPEKPPYPASKIYRYARGRDSPASLLRRRRPSGVAGGWGQLRPARGIRPRRGRGEGELEDEERERQGRRGPGHGVGLSACSVGGEAPQLFDRGLLAN